MPDIDDSLKSAEPPMSQPFGSARLSQFIVSNSEERITYRGVPLILWRTSTTDRPPIRRWHLEIVGYQAIAGLSSKEEAVRLASLFVDDILDGDIPISIRVEAKVEALLGALFAELEQTELEQAAPLRSDQTHKKQTRLVEKLLCMTTDNGCTPEEAANAQHLLEALRSNTSAR